MDRKLGNCKIRTNFWFGYVCDKNEDKYLAWSCVQQKWRQILGHVWHRLVVIRHRLWSQWVSNVVPPGPHASHCWYSVSVLRFALLCMVCFDLVCMVCIVWLVSNVVPWQTIGWHIRIDHMAHILLAIWGQLTLLGTKGTDFEAGGPDGRKKKWASPSGVLAGQLGGEKMSDLASIKVSTLYSSLYIEAAAFKCTGATFIFCK